MNDEQFGLPQIYTVVRATWLSRKPSTSAQLITMCSLLALIAVCTAYWSNFLGWAELMPATHDLVFKQKQLWRLWTTLFAHADVGHLVGNSFMFFILGYFLCGYFGARVFPIWALIMGGVTTLISLSTYPPDVRLIGASGMVSWMGGAWLTLYFKINTRISPYQRSLRAIGVALMLFAPLEAFDRAISYRTHAIGFALGILWAFAYYRARRGEFLGAEVRETLIE